MASYDDLGKVCRSAYVLEAGEYAIYIGTNVRDAAKIDFTYVVKEDTVTEQLSRNAAPYHLQKRMLADGSYEELPQREYVEEEGLRDRINMPSVFHALIQEDKRNRLS